MPRMPRLDLPGITQHVVQRGVDRQACFFSPDDYRYYLGALREAAWKHGCAVHAYVLMTNHVHLLVTPAEIGELSRMMQRLGRTYVRHVNDAAGRTGTLWEGRFRSGPVDTGNFVLACYRYIELNPVRAGIVGRPEDYRWSSHHRNAAGTEDGLLTPHAAYLSLGMNPTRRQNTYRALVEHGLEAAELADIRRHSRHQRAFGSLGFQQQIERQLGRRAGIAKAGRPRKSAGAK